MKTYKRLVNVSNQNLVFMTYRESHNMDASCWQIFKSKMAAVGLVFYCNWEIYFFPKYNVKLLCIPDRKLFMAYTPPPKKKLSNLNISEIHLFSFNFENLIFGQANEITFQLIKGIKNEDVFYLVILHYYRYYFFIFFLFLIK